MLYWLMKYVLLGPVLRLLWPMKVVGLENVPDSGGAILAGNHIAVADSFFMPLYVKRKVTFPAKQEYFTEKGIKGRLKKWFFLGVGQFPIDRSGGSAAQAALDTAIRLVRAGHLLGIYPEGTRSPDGRLYKGKTGVARIALESGGVVVPVAVLGTDKVNPIGSKMWRPRRLEVRFGKPLDFSRYEGLSGDRFVERSITDEIMYALMELSGQEYVDIYAARAKELADAEAGGIRPAVPTQAASGREAGRLPETKAG
ncbi:lysophospholipid acyltransferase family protein [Amycolatopsis cihanbeyliensis]|uniref:1-acyl-sn-glycerol-3-phosphate acyltransferase n=1 Tax=Amycolatopsis cihanbeyliensis TaxID=1128664 RepID=A0A542CT26_AMYCI|nr:lysophospholipid acyltransferase family protein [Amycolatopsis cihanbeyliensis]TQI93973.1 1-acyl-sn-glycerol-3-phosphate acyltransferase [Amycolatopsis cihanbeyliensis]